MHKLVSPEIVFNISKTNLIIKKFLEEVSRLYPIYPLPLNILYIHCCGVFFLQVNLVLFLENYDKNFDLYINCDVIFNKSITNGIRMESDHY